MKIDTDSTKEILQSDDGLFNRLQEENARLPPQDSTAFILAQIERQNTLLEKDPKSICIQSNELKAHFSTVQQLVTDSAVSECLFPDEQTLNSEGIDWGFWEAVIKDFDQVALRLPHLLSFKLRAGIPTRVRGLMWQAMSKSASLHLETVYGQLCNEKSPHERIIQRDLSRTFPRIDMFKQENGQGQASMKRILEAYSLYDLNVGYCQGLAFLVGPLLMNMNETQAFCVFVRLMETYEMRSMFTLNMEGLQLRLYQFSSLFSEILPELAEHFNKNSVHATIYASPWFLTLFAYVFPINLVSRIYDIIFAEGASETIMRVAIAMLKRSQDKILKEKLEFEDILDFVTSRKLCEPYTDNYGDVIKDAMALSGIITREKMDKLSESYVLDESQADKSKRTEQVLAGRFSFWKRRNSKKKKSVDLKRSASAGTPILKKRWSSVSSKDWSSSANTSPVTEQSPESSNQRTSFSSLRSLHNTATLGSGLPPTPESNNTSMKGQASLSAEFNKLKKEHQLVLEELLEVKYDKQDLECERDALKLTILELERRYYSENSKTNDRNNRMFDCNSIDPTDTTVSDDITTPSFSDIPVSFCKTDSASSHASTIYCDESTLNMSISPADDGSDEKNLHSELVHTKVKNFELQQQCEKLQQDLEHVQTKFDMMSEGQMALVEKLVTMKSDVEEVLNEKKTKDLEWLDTTQENKMLKQELEKLKCILHYTRLENNTLVQDLEILKNDNENSNDSLLDIHALGARYANISFSRVRRHSSSDLFGLSPTIEKRMIGRICDLEHSLTDSKIKLAEFEAASPTSMSSSSEPNLISLDKPKKSNKMERSTSLYGRFVHALSPRYSSFVTKAHSPN